MIGNLKGGEAYRECVVSGVVGNDADSRRFKMAGCPEGFKMAGCPEGLREALNKEEGAY